MRRALVSSWVAPELKISLAKRYVYLRQNKKMGVLAATLTMLLLLVAYSVFYLEGSAWNNLLKKYRPWFSHLSNRTYRRGDALRYLIQALWLIMVVPAQMATRSSFTRTRAVAYKIKMLLVNGRLLLHQRLAFWGHELVTTNRTMHTLLHLSENSSLFIKKQKGWRLFIALLAALLTFALALLLISQPFTPTAQLVFVLLLWSAAMLIRRVPGHFPVLLLVVLSLTVSTRYIWWRYTATLNWDSNKDLFFGLLLVLAETYSWAVLVMGYIQTAWPLKRKVAPLPKDQSLWPVVDVMIPTYNESIDVVRPTVYAALGMDWPQDKLRIHLLDDGRRPAFREFAQEVGINYLIRPDGRHAKAGNLNHAMGHTDGELIAIFDCYHVPTRSFLQLTVGWFLRDKKLALVQTPHHFFSPDPFERNLDSFGKRPNENTLFYGLIQDGNDLWNGAFFCGSCAVLKRSALNEIGGFAVETVTEDAHTALRLHRQGYNSAYLRIPMAAGLATESLSAHIGQRIRWARGMVQIFRTDNPLLGKGLSLFQRICYANAMFHFLAGVPRLIYLTAPLAFLLFHSYIIYAPVVLILLYVLPHMVHASITNSIMQGAHRHTFWGEVYETVLAWYIAIPTTVALFAPHKGSFNVTAKGGLVEKNYFDWKIALPYVLLAAANFLGFAVGIWRLFTGPTGEILTVIITMLWVIYNLVILGCAVAVAAENKQIRTNHRVTTSLPAQLKAADGRVYAAVLRDFSSEGVGLELASSTHFESKEPVTVLLSRGDRQCAFKGQVTRFSQGHLGVFFSNLSQEQQIHFVQCTFARADSWLSAGRNFSLDQPLSSFRDVWWTCIEGYHRLISYVPFPFNIVPQALLHSVLWLISFLPRRSPMAPYEK